MLVRVSSLYFFHSSKCPGDKLGSWKGALPVLTLPAQHIFPLLPSSGWGGLPTPSAHLCPGSEELPEMPRLRCSGQLCQAPPLEPREFPGWWAVGPGWRGGGAVDRAGDDRS